MQTSDNIDREINGFGLKFPAVNFHTQFLFTHPELKPLLFNISF
jgi:hypothetical protein